mmetsp:Transcript_8306/g.11447  ORF Transcript_8306/g.11447 Transcript_8306/m.11447 type:complete len:133 (+) Transcript_8306:3213-3611(+)
MLGSDVEEVIAFGLFVTGGGRGAFDNCCCITRSSEAASLLSLMKEPDLVLFVEGEEEEEAPVEGEEDGLAGLGVRLGLTDGVRVGLPDGDRVGLAVRDADTEGVRDGLPAAGEGLEEGEAVEPPGSVIAPKV